MKNIGGVNAEVFGGSILVATAAPNNYSGLLPSKMTIARFAADEHDRNRLKQGLVVASALTTAEAIGASLVFESWLPLFATAAVCSILVWQYLDAINNPHPDSMPINDQRNTNY